jgi:folate-binding protein YgfZ
VIGLLLVARREEGYLLLAASALMARLLQRLQMFVLRSEVILSPATELAVSGLSGDPGVAGRIIRARACPELAYVLQDSEDRESADRESAGTLSWKARELAGGVVWLDESTSEKFIPQMLGFERIGAVSFSKGCYPGQEIVARARYLGKVKRGPLLVKIEEAPQVEPGEAVEISDGQEWRDATLVDRAPTGDGGALLFLVASVDDGKEAAEVRLRSRRYRCATT